MKAKRTRTLPDNPAARFWDRVPGHLLREAYGRVVKSLLRRHGLPLGAFAKSIGIDRDTMHSTIRGLHPPTWQTQQSIARGLHRLPEEIGALARRWLRKWLRRNFVRGRN